LTASDISQLAHLATN